jgi:CBS-domain-containing membrane protein
MVHRLPTCKAASVAQVPADNASIVDSVERNGAEMTLHDGSILSKQLDQERSAPLFVLKRLSGSEACPPRPSLRQIATAFIGALIGVSIITLATTVAHLPLILGSFGASCFILFGFPDSSFAQPRNVIGGHFLASLTGLVFLSLCGTSWWSMSVAVATSIALMQAMRAAHPPAASNPIIVMLTAPVWSFLFVPTLAGSCALVLAAIVYHNTVGRRNYPKYWM